MRLLLAVFLTASFSVVSSANANDSSDTILLDCRINAVPTLGGWELGSGDAPDLKNYFFLEQKHTIKDEVAHSLDFAENGKVLKSNSSRIEFKYVIPIEGARAIFFYTYLRSKNLLVQVVQTGKKWIQPQEARGKCTEHRVDLSTVKSEIEQLQNSAETGQKPGVMDLDKAKTTCGELGFSTGTEKYGDCVMQLMSN